jgi:hypothetical protein
VEQIQAHLRALYKIALEDVRTHYVIHEGNTRYCAIIRDHPEITTVAIAVIKLPPGIVCACVSVSECVSVRD